MKKISLFVLFTLLVAGSASSQQRKYSTFYYQRATLFEKLSITSKDIVFLGNSITNGGEWCELFQNPRVKNRGISGDVCAGVYDRLDAIVTGKPAKIFLLIGINDFSRGTSADSIVSGIDKIIEKIQRVSPRTNIYVQSLLPVNDCFGMFSGHTKRWQEIKPLNEKIKRLSEERKVTYIDLYSHFLQSGTEKMDTIYTNDGLHLLGEGYVKWVEIIKPYLSNKKK